VDADHGYLVEAPLRVKCPSCFTNPVECGQMQQRAQAHQEAVNKWFKNWGCLNRKFHHCILKHADIFPAVAVITQVALQNGEPLFDKEDSDDISL
jgi:DNA-binding GntR family transcriptional regulator